MNPRAVLSTLIILGLFLAPACAAGRDMCRPTKPDVEGPFYKPGAPLRESTGTGLVIRGRVLAAAGCEPVPGARVEWWQAGPDGQYDDAHRGALLTGRDGRYLLSTDPPPPYWSRPPHVHFKVRAPAHETLTTQIYPLPGRDVIDFDFVLKQGTAD